MPGEKTDDLAYLSATQALTLFQEKSLSPVELIDTILHRAEAVQPLVNPFADTYFEQARVNAKESEQRYLTGKAHTLDGIPLLVKDASPVKGTRTTVGSLINKDNVDEHTDPSIERLLHAGSNLFAKSTCPEFCWLFTCHSRMWGTTRNPWRLSITPGGSSGGSAAAVAAGATTLATGSDSTGSTRQPAAQCGVVGFKPPYGRNPLGAKASFRPSVSVGPMTRTVADAALMQNVISGPHPLDHCSLHDRLVLPDILGDVSEMKLAFSMDLGHYIVDDDVQRETQSALDCLRDAGAHIEEVDIHWASEAIRLAHLSEEFIFAGSLKKAVEENTESLSDYIPEVLKTALSATPDDYRNAITHAGQVWYEYLGPLFEKYDALLTPTVSCPEVPAELWQQQTITVKGQEVTDTDTAMTALFNMFSRCPVLSVPSGMTDNGLPTSLQIISAAV